MVATPLNETLLLSLLDRQPNAVVYYSPIFQNNRSKVVIDFRVAYCNEESAKETGVSISELENQQVSLLPRTDQKTRELIFQQLMEVYSSGESSESTYYNSDLGKYFHLKRSKVGDGVLSIADNVTTQIREKEEKEKQAVFSKLVLDSSLSSWFSCEVVEDSSGAIIDFLITSINPRFTEMLGLSPEQVIGKSFLTLFPSSKDNGMFDLNRSVLQTGKTAQQQMHYSGDGLDAWYEVVVSKLGEKSLLINFDDITAYKHSIGEIQQKNILLDNILFCSANGISVTKVMRDEKGRVVDGRTILANDAAIRYTGLPKEVYLTKTAVEIEPNIVQSPYFQMCVHTLETGQPSFVQYQMESTGRWLEVSVSKMDEDHIITIFTDITPAKQAEINQEKLFEELRRSNTALEDFARTASHDLKEPIRKVQFFVDRLKAKLDGKMDEEESRIVERIENASARMKLLVDDLLDYAHLKQNPQELEEVDLNVKLKNIISDLELVIQEKGAQIKIGHLPTVRGFRRQLQQIFQNLISNSMKYVRPGTKPVIEINSREIQGKDAEVSLPENLLSKKFHLIQIRDNGIGFNQEDAQRIFTVFTRLHGNSEYAGTGIGLSIVKKAVENHHGFIYASGEEGKGAQFNILLPA
ncbi:MAG: ATP-binding protein [Flavisolibacter sp.]